MPEHQGDKSIFSQLTTKTLSSVSATDISTQTNPLHIEKANEDALKATVLVNAASMRGDGGPIPGSGLFFTATAEDDSETLDLFLGDDYPGAVWKLGAVSLEPNNVNIRVRLRLYNVDQTIAIEIGDETGLGSAGPFDPTATMGALFIDETARLRAYCDGMAGGRSVTVTGYLLRVR